MNLKFEKDSERADSHQAMIKNSSKKCLDPDIMYSIYTGSNNTKLHKIVGCFMMKVPWPLSLGRSQVKVSEESSMAHCQHWLNPSITFWVILLSNKHKHMLSHNLLIMWNKLSKTYKWSFLNLIAVGFAKIIFMGDK